MNNISDCSEGLLGLNWWHLGSWIGKVPRDAQQELHRLENKKHLKIFISTDKSEGGVLSLNWLF